MAEPKILLLDEPSLGLAPLIVEQIRVIIVQVNQQCTRVLLVEQNATMALSIAEYGYVFEHGLIFTDGTGQALPDDKVIRDSYLAMAAAGRRSVLELHTHRDKPNHGPEIA